MSQRSFKRWELDLAMAIGYALGVYAGHAKPWPFSPVADALLSFLFALALLGISRTLASRATPSERSGQA